MSNIGADNSRFKDIIKNKIKDNLKDLVSKEYLIGQQGARTIKIPITNIDIPRFRFGSNNGGPGMGSGDIGDPVDGSPGKDKSKSGKPGNDPGEHEFNAEFSSDELAALIKEELHLPDLEPKEAGEISTDSNKYNGISNVGNEGLRHNKRTYKQALQRQISSGTYNPDKPIIIPERNDKRYKSASVETKPDVKAVAIYIMDASGSMGDEQRHLVKSQVFIIDLLLRSTYKNIESVFIIHDMEAHEVSRDDFFKISSSGGTLISSSYKLCAELLNTKFPFNSWNSYCFSFGDGDNYSNADNYDCGILLKDTILKNCNRFAYGQVKSDGGSGDYLEFMKANFADHPNVVMSHVNGSNDILNSIKSFFK